MPKQETPLQKLRQIRKTLQMLMSNKPVMRSNEPVAEEYKKAVNNAHQLIQMYREHAFDKPAESGNGCKCDYCSDDAFERGACKECRP